jgi:hypothetical protein
VPNVRVIMNNKLENKYKEVVVPNLSITWYRSWWNETNPKEGCRLLILYNVGDRRMRIGHWWNGNDGKKPKYSEKTPIQCHYVQRTSHVQCPGIEHRPPLWNAEDQALSHMALTDVLRTGN